MIRIALFLGFFAAFTAWGQSWKFRKEASEVMQPVDSTYAIEYAAGTAEEYDFLSEGTTPIWSYFISLLKENSRNRPDTLMQSENLNQLAQLATKYWKSSALYADKKKWSKLDKYFRRAARGTNFKFGIIKQVSFRVPLVNLVGKKFYYDPKGEAGGSNLYMGRRPKTKAERENQTPLRNYSLNEIGEVFLKRLPQRYLRELKKGNIAYAGMSVELDQNSLNRTKIPTVRVVIVFGARRFRNIRESNTFRKQ